MPTNNWPYLLSEDARFAQAFRLSEDEVLAMFGGLKGYTQHRLNRDQVRATGHDIAMLSDNLEDNLESLKFTDLDEKKWGAQLVRDQQTKVSGIMSLLKVNKEMKASEERQAEIKAIEKGRTFKYLCEEANRRWGWPVGSQSARDWAQGEQERQQARGSAQGQR